MSTNGWLTIEQRYSLDPPSEDDTLDHFDQESFDWEGEEEEEEDEMEVC